MLSLLRCSFVCGLGLITAFATAVTSAETFEPVAAFPRLPAGYVLGRCSAVATNAKGEVYLFHRGKHPVLCVDTDGRFLRAWDGDPVGTAHGMRVDRGGHVWVTDIGRHRVLKFDPHGKLLLALGTGQKGTGPDQFDQPTDIAFGADGAIYVSDGYGNSRVVKFSADGRFEKTWGRRGKEPGEFHTPHAIVFDKLGRLLVGDRENDRIQVFDTEGQPLAQWNGFAPFGLAVDGQGHVYVADGRAHEVLRLDANGRVQQRFGREGAEPGQFRLPHMLAFDAAGDLYVAEVMGMRFQKLHRKP